MLKQLINFFDRKKDLPIVSHSVKHDRDKVLNPLFKKLGLEDKMPLKERYRCTVAMCDRLPDIEDRHLDQVLKYFKIPGRKDVE